jgi:hypothetical protein
MTDTGNHARTTRHYTESFLVTGLYVFNHFETRSNVLLAKKVSDLTEHDKLDVIISLQILLEAGVNSVIRDLAVHSLKKDITYVDVAKDLDGIGFREKTASFIYGATFDFGADIAEASTRRKVLGKMQNFTRYRNAIMHGHTIAQQSIDGNRSSTALHDILEDDEAFKQHVKQYAEIVNDLKFYIDHLSEGSIDKDKLTKSYLRVPLSLNRFIL